MNLRRLISSPMTAACALALAYVVVLWVTAPAMGFTRDEGYYFKAAEEYAGWWGTLFSRRFFDAFTDAEILKHFSYNTEHPALVKLSQGVTYHLFHGLLGIASPAQGFRASGFLFAGLSLVATFLLGRTLVSARVGLVAAALVASQPRYFYDAHLACFDVAITAMWTLAMWAFCRALAAPEGVARRRAVFAGVMFGLALATKLNALFLPFIFVFLWLVAGPEPVLPRLVRGPSGGLDVALPRVPWVLIACAVIGPLVFIAHWPYVWHETFLRIGKYIGFHLHHEHYPALYFHQLLVKPPFPWSFPVWMTIYTAPAPLLVLGGLGLVVSAWRALTRRTLADAALLATAVLPIFLIAMPTTPIFGGVKHWYNAMPSLAILAARSLFWGVDLLAERWAAPRARWAAAVAFSVLVLLPGTLGTMRSHPNGIGYYNEIAGGFRGGAEIGMQRGFWGGLAGPLFPKFGALEGPSQRVFFNRTNYDSYRMYRREGTIPDSTWYSNDAKGAQVGLSFEQPEHAEREGEIWSAMGTRPIDGVYQDNVTLVQKYQKGPSALPPKRE